MNGLDGETLRCEIFANKLTELDVIIDDQESPRGTLVWACQFLRIAHYGTPDGGTVRECGEEIIVVRQRDDGKGGNGREARAIE